MTMYQFVQHQFMQRFLLVLACLLLGCSSAEQAPAYLELTEAQARPLTDRTFETTPERLARGEYLAEGLLRCFTCHSERDWDAPGAPPIEATKGAGAMYSVNADIWITAPNLTPDDETGIGTWTDDMLARAIREGVGHDGRVLHPAMDYGSFRRISDDDLAAVIVFLRSRLPVHNPLPPTVLPMQQQQELAGRLSPITEPVPARDLTDPLEHGRYLVLLGNCEGCHTSWYSSRNPGLLGGGNPIERGEKVAFSTNITAHTSGMAYPAAAFIQVIRTGKGGTLSPMMPWAVFQHLTDADLTAIHAFLQTMHPVAHHINNFAEPTQCFVCEQEHGLGELNELAIPEGMAIDVVLYDDYIGAYQSEEYGFIIRIKREGDRLLAQEDEGPVAQLIPQSETRFLMAGGIAPLRFVRDESGTVSTLISEEVEEIVLQRID